MRPDKTRHKGAGDATLLVEMWLQVMLLVQRVLVLPSDATLLGVLLRMLLGMLLSLLLGMLSAPGIALLSLLCSMLCPLCLLGLPGRHLLLSMLLMYILRLDLSPLAQVLLRLLQ